jgi:hypothetical protein
MSFIDAHLHRLILDHDCLVIPGLGGFVCSERPARFDEAASELIPPRRAIQFNERLLHNDGVLAHAVSIAESMPYAQALEAIELEAESLRSRLRTEKTVSIRLVGRLFVGTNGATQFLSEPELERLLDGFGLQPIPLRLVSRQSDPIVLPISTSTRWPRIAAAIAIPLMAGGLWWFSGSSESESLSFLPNWGAKAIHSQYVPQAHAENLPTLEEPMPYELALAGLDAVESIRFDFETNRLADDGIPVKLKELEVADDLSTPLDLFSSDFALVAGAFSQIANAEGHAANLTSQGLQADVHYHGTLHLVTVGLFTEERDARLVLSEVRAQGHDEVWMKRL